jgi:hypothetical protein
MAEEDLHDEEIDRWMRERTAMAAPAGFTSAVMGRVRQERWRTERYWDLGFNIAIAAGLLLIASGVSGLIYISGLSVVAHDAMLLFVNAITTVAAEAAPALPAYTGAFALITTALGLWWYVEHA